MQDRFKFRVWCKTNQEWEKDEICITNRGQYIITNTNPKFTRITNIDPQYHEINFCTGLKDKNGRLIYEGDIVSDAQYKYVVEWSLNNGYFVRKPWIEQLFTYRIDIGCTKNTIVIGNIYENPELLEVK